MTRYYKAYGFLEVTRGHGGKVTQKFYTIAYGGNMGATLQHVRECFDSLYGKFTFGKVYAHGVKEYGSPDYSWSIKVPTAAFERIVGTRL
jgi:hypothetical protein